MISTRYEFFQIRDKNRDLKFFGFPQVKLYSSKIKLTFLKSAQRRLFAKYKKFFKTTSWLLFTKTLFVFFNENNLSQICVFFLGSRNWLLQKVKCRISRWFFLKTKLNFLANHRLVSFHQRPKQQFADGRISFEKNNLDMILAFQTMWPKQSKKNKGLVCFWKPKLLFSEILIVLPWSMCKSTRLDTFCLVNFCVSFQAMKTLSLKDVKN